MLLTQALKGKKPHEVWYGEKALMKHLKIFCYICYAHTLESKRGKVDYKVEKGIFLGHSSVTKGNKIFRLRTQSVIVSRNVIFHEIAKWNWEISKMVATDEIKIEENMPQEQEVMENKDGSDMHDNFSIRGTRTIKNIYERCNVTSLEPTNFAEAKKIEGWKVATQKEIDMMNKNNIWNLIDKPQDQKVTGIKWVYRTKFNPDGFVNKHKVRLVVKGYV